MIIVSDTSAISNLYQIGLLDILTILYAEIMISPSVKRELYELEEQASTIEQLEWIKTVFPSNQKRIVELMNHYELDLGESESIVLALEQQADYLVIDEKLGRIAAKE